MEIYFAKWKWYRFSVDRPFVRMQRTEAVRGTFRNAHRGPQSDSLRLRARRESLAAAGPQGSAGRCWGFKLFKNYIDRLTIQWISKRRIQIHFIKRSPKWVNLFRSGLNFIGSKNWPLRAPSTNSGERDSPGKKRVLRKKRAPRRSMLSGRMFR